MLKQLQEMQQQQQLQELGGIRQQNYISQLSYLNKQASGGFHSSLAHGVPVHEVSQKFMVGNAHLSQHGASPIIQGFPNVFSQTQSQAMSMGMLPQQSEVSLYGTPNVNAENNLNQYSHLQGMSHDSANMFARGNNNTMEIPVMQPTAVKNSFIGGQLNDPEDKVSVLGGSFSPKNVSQDKNYFGQVLVPSSNDGVVSLNLQQLHSLQKEVGMRQEQTCWPSGEVRTPKVDLSQGSTSLDPLEEKILFNTDDCSWESALLGHGTMAMGGFGGAHEHADFISAFSATQSGSWSALMQSAVAEASSSDTGQQEEWSGLTFQNPEISADNQPTNYVGNGKQHNGWADANLQCVSSPTSKPQVQFQNSNPNHGFPRFQQSSYLVAKQSDGMHSDSSLESFQHSPQNARLWFDCNYQQKQPVEENQLVQTSAPLQNVWHGQQFEHSGSDGCQLNVSLYNNDSQPSHNIAGEELRKNVWLHRSRSETMVSDSPRASDQANIRRNARISEEMPSRNTVDYIAALFDSSAEFCGQSTIGHTRTGKSEENRTVTPLVSRNSVPLSQVPQIDTSDDRPYYKNSSASQGSGSGLGNQPQEDSYSSMFTSAPLHRGNHLQIQHQQVASAASQSPNAAFTGITKKLQGSISTTLDASNLMQTSIDGHVFPTLDTMQVVHPSLVPVVPQYVGHSMGPPSMSPYVPGPLHRLQSEMPKVSSGSLHSPDSTNSNTETASGASNEQYIQNSFQIGNSIKENNMFTPAAPGSDYKENLAALLNVPEASSSSSHGKILHGQESVMRHLPEGNSINSGSLMISTNHQVFDRDQHRDKNTPNMSGSDLEGFGRSFMPSPGHQQDFCMRHQVQNLRNLDASCSNKMLMKSNEADSGQNFQHANTNARQLSLYSEKLGIQNLIHEQNTKPQLNSFASGVNPLLRCSSYAGGNQLGKDLGKSFIQDGQLTLLSSLGEDQNPSKEQSRINVQMAPSWFKHYGTWKNGQISAMYDARGVKDAGRQFNISKSFEHFGQVYNAITSQLNSVPPSLAANQVVPKQLATPFLLASDITEQNLTVPRPKKRKVARFDPLPWHIEVSQGNQQFQKASDVAGIEWASASNKLYEKVEDEREIYDDLLPVSRAKRRLVLTTELMKQVFRPAPAVLLSQDACLSSESTIYFVCRLALGDACSLAGHSQTAFLKSDMSPEKLNSDKVGEADLSRTLEDFVARTKRAESCLLRLEKAASIIDVKVECQELEKFSVINRFAKFHSRGYTVSVDPSSSSGAAPTLQKMFAQRYVVAHPMPKVIPEETNCLSL